MNCNEWWNINDILDWMLFNCVLYFIVLNLKIDRMGVYFVFVFVFVKENVIGCVCVFIGLLIVE